MIPRAPAPSPGRLSANLPVDLVLLLVQDPLFGLRDMTAVLESHVAFFLPDLAIIMMETPCLAPRHVPFPDLPVNPVALVFKAAIYLHSPWVVVLPLACLRGRYSAYKTGGSGGHHDQRFLVEHIHPPGLRCGRRRPTCLLKRRVVCPAARAIVRAVGRSYGNAMPPEPATLSRTGQPRRRLGLCWHSGSQPQADSRSARFRVRVASRGIRIDPMTGLISFDG